MKVVTEPPNVKSWIVCDGDVDPEWIESLNSVHSPFIYIKPNPCLSRKCWFFINSVGFGAQKTMTHPLPHLQGVG